MHFATYYRWLTYSFLFAPLGFGSPARRLLDIGSKEGAFASLLAAKSAQIIGVDPVLPRRRSRVVTFALADGQRLPFANAVFDQVILNEVVEHIPDDRTAVREACRVLKPGGMLWLSTPALHYSVGPEWVTRRFEQAWGHVRRGYHPDQLASLFPRGMDLRLFMWHEPWIRALQLPLWVISRCCMGLARRLAYICFQLDRRAYERSRSSSTMSGHIYLFASRSQ